MNTLALVAILAFISGAGAGLAVRPRDKSHKVLEAQAQSLDALLDGQTEILTEAQKPVVLDANLKATLAETPPACIRELGGDPLSPQCLLMACWSYGQSSAQRPDCDAVEALVVQKGSESKSVP